MRLLQVACTRVRLPKLGLLAAAGLPWIWAVATPAIRTDDDDATIKAGLAAWRKPGGKFNAACSSCHSPDGFDLAVFDFPDKDIRRRAVMHVNRYEADLIVDMVHAVRRKYKIARPLDPVATRPFQPGGEVLAGTTAVERDLAFARQIQPMLPTLFGQRIDSLEKAKAAQSETLAIDVWQLKIGIPFNRWSEDVVHGKGRGLLADWIPDVPRSPKSDKSAAWFALQDEYVANPTERNMWRLIEAIDDHTAPFSQMTFSSFGTHKYRALLVAQHLLREAVSGAKPSRGKTTYFDSYAKPEVPSPIWDVGEYAALNMLFDHESQGMPEELMPQLSPEVGMPSHLSAIRPAWLWLGWMMDQGLQRTPGGFNTKSGRYFTLSLWEDGPYPMHSAFMIFRKQLAQSADAARFTLDYSEMGRKARAVRFMPRDPEVCAVFGRFASNAMRASLYLLVDDIEKNGPPADPTATAFHVEMCREFMEHFDLPSKVEDSKLAERARNLLSP